MPAQLSPGRPRNTMRSVLMRIEQRDKDECWPFLGCHDKNGYPAARLNKRWCRVHRIAYQASRRLPELKHQVYQKCGHKWCCNPHHLFQREHLRG